METTHKPSFDLTSSLKRINDILNEDNKNFNESSSIPSRDKLTYSNGFYVYCSALFVDIRDSSTMTDEHKRPILAKIYRSFISEMVALFNDSDIAKEVNIHGDCVWCVCDTPKKTNIDELFSLAAKACSMVDILNF
jgi:class 3 adenylate cyclase